MSSGCKRFLLPIVFLFASAASAGTLSPPVAEVPGSITFSTSPIGLSDLGIIDGSYRNPDQKFHGFLGTPDGKYALVDAAPDGTEMRSINDFGWATGISGIDTCASVDCSEFERAPDGTITPITMNGAPLHGIVQQINIFGQFVGDYHPPSAPFANQANGYIGSNGQYVADITLPFATRQTRPRGINNVGSIVGFFRLPGGNMQGFVLEAGTVTVINYPDPTATDTFLTNINDQGWISGQWVDVNGIYHAFLLNPFLTGFTPITVSGSANVQAFEINDLGEVAIVSDVGGFIYCMNDGDKRCSGGRHNHDAVASVKPGALSTFHCVHACRTVRIEPNTLSPSTAREAGSAIEQGKPHGVRP